MKKTKIPSKEENKPDQSRGDIVKMNAAMIEKTLESFGIQAHVIEIIIKNNYDFYCLEIALGTKLKRILELKKDLALALASPTGRIVIQTPVPGRSLVGIWLPNKKFVENSNSSVIVKIILHALDLYLQLKWNILNKI